MAVVNSHTIAGYLDALGIGYAAINDAVTMTAFDVDAHFYKSSIPVEIRTSPQWVSFRALIVSNLSETETNSVARYLCYLNSQSWGMRYGIVDSSVLATSEVHLLRLSKETFSEALSALLSSAAQAILSVRVMATNPGISKLYSDAERSVNANSILQLTTDDVLVQFDLRPNAAEKFIKREVKRTDDPK